ncbi:MAG: amino acid ABC transporter substrate-binding protein [Hyphomicrobium sp.]
MPRLGIVKAAVAAVMGCAALGGAAPASAGIIDAVRERGHVVCGVSEGTAGFSTVDGQGQWRGLDVEFCSAVAASVLGDKTAVKFRALSISDRFRALSGGEVDVLARSTTWTLSRDTELGLRFAGVLFHDGQGFMVRRAHALSSVLELSGASICAMAGTSADRALTDYFRQHQMRFQLVSAARWDDLMKAYASESCTLISSDISVLASERGFLANPGDHILLPEMIWKEPMGPAVRQGDEQWFAIVRWTLMALINAEELGLTSSNVDEARGSSNPTIRQFLGLESNLGQAMGLAADWVYQIVKQVGNYGEIFERTVGAKSTLRLERGLNDLWTRGGLMQSPPFR